MGFVLAGILHWGIVSNTDSDNYLCGEEMITHEQYLQAVREIAIERLPLGCDERELLRRAKLVYGRGQGGMRGVTCYDQWANTEHGDSDDRGAKKHGLVELIEICASGEENHVQLAGTVLHELAHVLAGHEAGHKADWKSWCKVLGIPGAKAKDTSYDGEGVWDEDVLKAVLELEQPTDGKPNAGGVTMRIGKGGCATGQKKQNARLRLWECSCTPKPVKLRVASDELNAMCMTCGEMFTTQQVVDGGDDDGDDNSD